MVLVVPVSALCPLLALMCELGLHNKREVGGIKKKQVLFAIWKAEGSKIKETDLAANGALLSDLERSTVLYAFRWVSCSTSAEDPPFLFLPFVFSYPSLPVLEMTIWQSLTCGNLAREHQTASGKQEQGGRRSPPWWLEWRVPGGDSKWRWRSRPVYHGGKSKFRSLHDGLGFGDIKAIKFLRRQYGDRGKPRTGPLLPQAGLVIIWDCLCLFVFFFFSYL